MGAVWAMRGKVAFGSAGIGTMAHIAPELARLERGIHRCGDPAPPLPANGCAAGRRSCWAMISPIEAPQGLVKKLADYFTRKQFGRVPTPITRRMMIRILETLHEVGFMLHHEDFN